MNPDIVKPFFVSLQLPTAVSPTVVSQDPSTILPPTVMNPIPQLPPSNHFAMPFPVPMAPCTSNGANQVAVPNSITRYSNPSAPKPAPAYSNHSVPPQVVTAAQPIPRYNNSSVPVQLSALNQHWVPATKPDPRHSKISVRAPVAVPGYINPSVPIAPNPVQSSTPTIIDTAMQEAAIPNLLPSNSTPNTILTHKITGIDMEHPQVPYNPNLTNPSNPNPTTPFQFSNTNLPNYINLSSLLQTMQGVPVDPTNSNQQSSLATIQPPIVPNMNPTVPDPQQVNTVPNPVPLSLTNGINCNCPIHRKLKKRAGRRSAFHVYRGTVSNYRTYRNLSSSFQDLPVPRLPSPRPFHRLAQWMYQPTHPHRPRPQLLRLLQSRKRRNNHPLPARYLPISISGSVDSVIPRTVFHYSNPATPTTPNPSLRSPRPPIKSAHFDALEAEGTVSSA